jgi:hypothetical protein
MTTFSSRKAPSNPDDRSKFTTTLAELFFDPIIRSFIPVSRSIFLVPPRTPTTASGPLSSKGPTPVNESERGMESNRQRHDIRPSLLTTIQRTLDSLRFARPDFALALCFLTSLSVTPELRRIWLVGSSSQEVGSIQHKTNRNRTKEEKEDFEKQEMQDLADHDAAWYLLAVLNLCFESEVPLSSTSSSPLVELLKMRLTYELTELSRVLCFTDRPDRIRTVKAGSGPTLVEEEIILGVYERAWLNGWLAGPTHLDTENLTRGQEKTNVGAGPCLPQVS